MNLNPFVKNVVKAFGKPVKICDSEITELKNCLKNYTENIEVTSGDSVSIESGLFKNKNGIIDEINGNSVTLLINSIKVKLSMSSSKLVLAS